MIDSFPAFSYQADFGAEPRRLVAADGFELIGTCQDGGGFPASPLRVVATADDGSLVVRAENNAGAPLNPTGESDMTSDSVERYYVDSDFDTDEGVRLMEQGVVNSQAGTIGVSSAGGNSTTIDYAITVNPDQPQGDCVIAGTTIG